MTSVCPHQMVLNGGGEFSFTKPMIFTITIFKARGNSLCQCAHKVMAQGYLIVPRVLVGINFQI